MCRLLLLFSPFYTWSRLDHYWSNVHQQDHCSGYLQKRFTCLSVLTRYSKRLIKNWQIGDRLMVWPAANAAQNKLCEPGSCFPEYWFAENERSLFGKLPFSDGKFPFSKGKFPFCKGKFAVLMILVSISRYVVMQCNTAVYSLVLVSYSLFVDRVLLSNISGRELTRYLLLWLEIDILSSIQSNVSENQFLYWNHFGISWLKWEWYSQIHK